MVFCAYAVRRKQLNPPWGLTFLVLGVTLVFVCEENC